ncbi:MAG: segregation/condensation protein A [Firmicutes bacterium]|nr:segregation/condensation protein A [Bacillota bacterium]
MSYRVQLDVFDGPLELLLHLLEQDKLDIRDIEISRITQQYLDYLATMQEYDLEVTGDFLVMAATLLQIKVGALLPDAEAEAEPEDQEIIYSRDELIRRLLVYRQFREAAQSLADLAQSRRQVYPRPVSLLGPKGPVVYTNPVGDVTVQDLASIYASTLLNWQAREEVRQVKRRAIDLNAKIGEIALLVQKHTRLVFDELLGRQPTKTDVVYTFLAVLELVKQGIVRVQQSGIDEPIIISFDKE